ncbi:MAG: hypothetical protein ACYTGQ_19635, partial [Planctomycetota bacterium]|jgi:hypothetical protein
VLSNPARDHHDCVHAQCESESINSGVGLGLDSLVATTDPETGTVTLDWAPPIGDWAHGFQVYRTTRGSHSWELLLETTVPGFVDDTVQPGVDYDYKVIYRP